MRRSLPLILAALLPFLTAAGPSEVTRVLKSFDFEERRLGNREELPMNWSKVTGPGLPAYLNGNLSNDVAHTGQWSFRFDLNGGSLIYRYDPTQCPVQQGAHYHVKGFVRTTSLPNARARITAYFTDIDGHPIAASAVHSELYAAGMTQDEWKELSIDLSADRPDASFLCVELELLQPSLYAVSALGERALYDQDIHGSAWFDDVTIAQVPQVVMQSGKPGNIFRRSDLLQLQVLVSDRFTDDLAAQLIVRNATGKAVYQHSGALDMGTATVVKPGVRQLLLTLPDLKTGWYVASLEMTSGGKRLGQQDLQLVRLADDDMDTQPDPRFGVTAVDLPFAGWSQLPEVLPILSAGRVKLAVWGKGGDVEEINASAFDLLLDQLSKKGITPTACINELPPELARRAGGSELSRLMSLPVENWRPELAYMVARHANHLDRWQFGADRDADLFLSQPEMRRAYDTIYAEFVKMMVNPDLAMPWPAWYDLSGNLPATVALSVSPDVLPAQLPLYIEDLKGHDGHNLSVTLQMLDDRYGRDVQIRDLAQRVVYALAGGAKRIDLPLPFTVMMRGEYVNNQPSELLLIMRTLMTQLSGATYLGKIPNTSNVEALLFDRDGEGIVVLWSRGVEQGATQLALNLGQHPRQIDLWGNVTPLIQSQNASLDTVKLNVGPMPFFLVDVDSATAQMRSSVGIDKPLLESSFEPHSRRIHFTNPGKITIGGTLKLTGPKGWTVTPSVFSFTLNPGETFDHEISIEFPYNSFAGSKVISADFQVQAERNTSFVVPIAVSLGLSDVGMRVIALRDKADLIVQQMISNYGDKPVNYTAFAVYPGQPRQERLVTQLGSGRTIIKLYRFPNVNIIKNAKVRCGLREQEGTRILNDEVAVQ